jgi:gliding motility-associated lipoprotein GldB
MSKSWFFIIIPLILLSCKRNPHKVDISGIDKEIEVIRFEKELFALPLSDTLYELSQLRNKYPEFFDLFTWKVINIGGIEDEHFPKLMTEFLTDTMIRDIKISVQEEFSDFEDIENGLIRTFKYYQYHFAVKKIPTIFTMISGFNQSVVTAENIIGISLDKYLGRDCNYYTQLNNVPMYKIKNMHPGKILSDVVYAWGMTEFNDMDETTTLLDNIVYQGKLMYLTDAMLPEMHDTMKIGYTAQQLEWCSKNEPHMWNYIIENKKLYSNKRMDILRYINDGPYTTGFPIESPPRTGIWIGWQIVKQYMKKNENVTLPELMENTDYQQILNDSKYYPE